ncbi:MAG: radical SAM protein [Candidatus Omnitrophica bacterium]|nr:radical SAM protein [Candidatus Omnitrophota bacterium]
MSVLFIKPNAKKNQYGRVVHLSAIEPPVWLALLAQATPGARVIDMEAEGLDIAGLLARLGAEAPERAVILSTGTHPSAHIQQAEVSEALRVALVQAFGIKVDVYNYLPFEPVEAGAIDLGLLPVEKYRAHNWHAWGRKDRSYGATFASVSCPFTCEFCCVKDFYKAGYVQRGPELVARDIQAYVQRGVTNFKMMDELFVINNPGVHAVCDALIASGLGPKINIWAYARIDTVTPDLLKKVRAAGIRWLAYGIESGNEKIRAGVLKGRFDNNKIREVIQMTKDADISIVGNYMFGFWDDTQATMQETLDLATELNCEYSNFYCVSVYPGSALYGAMQAKGVDLPLTSEEFSQMSPNFKPVPTEHVSGRDVLQFRDRAFNAYFSSARYLAMMEGRFGRNVVEEIKAMTAINIREKA